MRHLQTIMLHVKLWYWRFMLREAQDFAYRLENTIANERLRSRDDLHHCEIMERRAELAIIAHRADSKRVTA